jgi:hypothetical protein
VKYNVTTKERAADSSKQLKAQHNLKNPRRTKQMYGGREIELFHPNHN